MSRRSSGPDATGVGWALEYALIDKTGKHSLAELRTLQDWQVQYQIRAVPGVAEVASVGGFVKQYQVTIDPNKLQAHKISINQVVEQIRAQQSRGGRPCAGVHAAGVHGARPGLYPKCGRPRDGGVGRADRMEPPFWSGTWASSSSGPDIRRGAVDFNGLGDAAGGIVVVRYGESVYDVLAHVKQVIKDAGSALAPGRRGTGGHL